MNTTITMCGLGLALAASCVVPVYGAATTGAGEVAVAPAVEPAADMETFRSLCAAIDYNSNDVEAALCRIRDMAEELLGWDIDNWEVRALLGEVERRVEDGLTYRIRKAKADLGCPVTEGKAKALYDLKLKALPEIDAVLTFTDKRDYAHYYKKRANLVRSYMDKLKELGVEVDASLKRAADTADMLATPTGYSIVISSDGDLLCNPRDANIFVRCRDGYVFRKKQGADRIQGFQLLGRMVWSIGSGSIRLYMESQTGWWPTVHSREIEYGNSLEEPALLALLRRHGRTLKIVGATFSWTTEGVTSYKIQAGGKDITEALLKEAIEKVIQDSYWTNLRASLLSVDERH